MGEEEVHQWGIKEQFIRVRKVVSEGNEGTGEEGY
jgi:hypothetical protein